AHFRQSVVNNVTGLVGPRISERLINTEFDGFFPKADHLLFPLSLGILWLLCLRGIALPRSCTSQI
ncbi:unnamed protein product, partial [Onchocerca ochengi]